MVRGVIADTPPGSNRMMSAGIMVELIVERGLALHLAKRLYSQIRKGAPLHNEWRDAFAEGRFHQRQGRAAMPDDPQADTALAAAPKPGAQAHETAGAKLVVPSRASARQCAANVSMAASMTFWLDPTFSKEGSEKDTLNLFNNAADVMGTHPTGVDRGPFDGFAEVNASFDAAFLLGPGPSPNTKRSAPDDAGGGPVAQQPRHEAGLQSSADELFDMAFGAFA